MCDEDGDGNTNDNDQVCQAPGGSLVLTYRLGGGGGGRAGRGNEGKME